MAAPMASPELEPSNWLYRKTLSVRRRFGWESEIRTTRRDLGHQSLSTSSSVRSNLWKPAEWPALEGLPSLAQTMVDAAALPMPVEALDQIIKQDEVERLY